MQNWMTFERQDISPSMLGPKDLAVGALTDHGPSAWPVSTHKSAGKTEGLSRTDYRSNDNRDDDIDIYIYIYDHTIVVSLIIIDEFF